MPSPRCCDKDFLSVLVPTAQNTAYIPSTGLFEVGLQIYMLCGGKSHEQAMSDYMYCQILWQCQVIGKTVFTILLLPDTVCFCLQLFCFNELLS